jgi:hypothetical protein
MTERVDVPRRYHRSLLGESGTFVHDIERKTGCRIRFPDRELALDHVDIFGPEATVHVAGPMLLVSPDSDPNCRPHTSLSNTISPHSVSDPYLFPHLPLYSSHNLVLCRIMCRSKLR